MNITIFTGNQPRHLALIHELAAVASELFVIQECTTMWPGMVADSIYNSSEVMKAYFAHVTSAEKMLFGNVGFSPVNARTLSLKMGDIAHMPEAWLAEAMRSDIFVVFGASYIKPPLVDALIEKKAINIHMGVSPYFRGSACNFWALYDCYPELVGATIHLLSRGLDSGDILFHAMPDPRGCDGFLLGMKAVQAAHKALADAIRNKTLMVHTPTSQNRALEIRYSRYRDFTDDVAENYLKTRLDSATLGSQIIKRRSQHALIMPASS
jgi:folate-dependent phosphoribosylglycinamide formyltransferase PurN